MNRVLVFITAEIGINHNGDIDIAKKLIDIAVSSGCDAVKFQKRNVEKVYTQEFLSQPRESPWGTTQRDQKKGLEFEEKEYDEINNFCKSINIEWFCSAWDINSLNFLKKYNLKKNYDLLIVDFHGEITSEKMAIGHFFDGEASLVVGTHTHVPTSDTMILKKGTAYQTDAGMCGDYNSVIGMNKDNSINRFLKKSSLKHYPATGEASLCGSIVECNLETGLANSINQFIFGGDLKNSH